MVNNSPKEGLPELLGAEGFNPPRLHGGSGSSGGVSLRGQGRPLSGVLWKYRGEQSTGRKMPPALLSPSAPIFTGALGRPRGGGICSPECLCS